MAYRVLRCILAVIMPLLALAVETVIDTSDLGYYDDRTWSDTYMADWSNPDWALISGRSQQRTCVDIPDNLTLCQNLKYDKMILPNLLGHDSLREVSQQSSSWISLLNIKCHPDTKVFLCSLFAPVCLDRLIWPCRSLCQAVKAGCEGRMLSYRFPWPKMVKCDKFPLDNDLCIRSRSEKENNVCPPCNSPHNMEAILDKFCTGKFVMKAKVKQLKMVGDHLLIKILKKKKIYKKEGIKKRVLNSGALVIMNGAKCSCPVVNVTENREYLFTGETDGRNAVVNSIYRWDKRQKAEYRELRDCLKTLRKKADVCKGGVNALEDVNSMKSTRSNKKKRRGRKHPKSKKNRRPKTDEVFFRKRK